MGLHHTHIYIFTKTADAISDKLNIKRLSLIRSNSCNLQMCKQANLASHLPGKGGILLKLLHLDRDSRNQIRTLTLWRNIFQWARQMTQNIIVKGRIVKAANYATLFIDKQLIDNAS